MKQSAKIFRLLVIAAGLIVLATIDYSAFLSLGTQDVLALAILVGLGILSEALPQVTYSVAGRAVFTSVAFIPLFTTIVLFPAPVAVISAAAMYGPSLFLLRKYPVETTLFNVSQVCIATLTAAMLWDVTAGVAVLGFPLVRLFLMSVGLFATNIIFSAMFLSLSRDLGLLKTALRIIGPGGSNLYYDLLVSPLALLTASVYANMGVAGILILMLPLLIIRQSYLAVAESQQANKALLQVLIKAIETRDPYTSGHSIRVSILSRAVAEALGLQGKKADEVETAALLHDIGKVDGIYAELIQKPHALSSAEIGVIRTHATRGADFVESLNIYQREIIDSIRHHHEKYDGTGYPAGISGAQIPLAARIIQIADSVDAMLSDRPYRNALTLDDVYSELSRCAGSQFDPELIAAIMRDQTIARVFAQLKQHTKPSVLSTALQDA